jgi:hypothetical protein
MKYFLSFMGYPRSGHTLVAAILNANPNCIVSNQLHLYGSKEIDFQYIANYSKNTGTWKPTTQVPHVPKQEIKVIGDKTGHRTVLTLSKNPQRLGEVKANIGMPIKWIHVVRNPFDTLATWTKIEYERKKSVPNQELNMVIEKYKLLNKTIERLKRSEDVLTVRHEYVITRMHNTLEEICDFLEISFDPQWRDNVRNTVWNKPRITRRDIPWTSKQKGIVHDIIDQYDWFKGYDFGCGRC